MGSRLSAIAVGLDAMRSNPMRALLATLGVIIGVAALVAVLSLGDGMELMARAEVERTTGVQIVAVASKTTETIDGQIFPVRDYPVFGIADARSMDDELPNAAGVSLTLSGAATIEYPETGKRRRSGVTATLADADQFMSLDLAAGRYFTRAEADHRAPVVALSNKLAAELAAGAPPETMLGHQVRVSGSLREVIGVMAPYKGERSLNFYVPFTAAAQVMPGSGPAHTPQLLVKARGVEAVDRLKADVEDWAARHYGRWERRIDISTSDSRLAQVTQGILVFKLFMGAITGISLLVGGIGIMNVLLASVAERTREIGIRKALGARRRDIAFQFLAESVVISGTGSLLGAALGLGGAFGVVAIIRMRAEGVLLDASFSWSTILVAMISAVAVGLAFGTYPARRAAKLSPIDAIRDE